VNGKGSFPHITTVEHQTKRVKHLSFALSIPVAERVCALNEDAIADDTYSLLLVYIEIQLSKS